MIYNPIGDTILRLLERKNISQSTLASRMDTSETTVSRWVNGTRPRANQWEGIFGGLECTQYEFELALARVLCEYCMKQARELGEPVPVFNSSPIMRKIESILALDLELVSGKKRQPMRRLRDLLVTMVTQCEPLLREFEELYTGSVGTAAGDAP